ncbi:MAG TPA: Chromate resistance protein ChrB, partial [Aggregatilineales bacterium]|nr:Chromate resistance protein ChrB [Aggregatilineales bacterium]
DPTASRVYVWRKLKRLGAILLHDSVWVLPPTPYTREQLQWLATEIQEMDGEANLWEAHRLPPGQDSDLVAQFAKQTDAAYDEILAGLVSIQTDLAALSRRYQQVKASDYFGSALGARVREALIEARGGREP